MALAGREVQIQRSGVIGRGQRTASDASQVQPRQPVVTRGIEVFLAGGELFAACSQRFEGAGEHEVHFFQGA